MSEIIFIHIKTYLHQVNTSIYDNIYIRQRPLLIKQAEVFVLSFVFIGYMDQLFIPIRFFVETYPLHNDNQRGDDDKRTPTKCVISCCVI